MVLKSSGPGGHPSNFICFRDSRISNQRLGVSTCGVFASIAMDATERFLAIEVSKRNQMVSPPHAARFPLRMVRASIAQCTQSFCGTPLGTSIRRPVSRILQIPQAFLSLVALARLS